MPTWHVIPSEVSVTRRSDIYVVACAFPFTLTVCSLRGQRHFSHSGPTTLNRRSLRKCVVMERLVSSTANRDDPLSRSRSRQRSGMGRRPGPLAISVASSGLCVRPKHQGSPGARSVSRSRLTFTHEDSCADDAESRWYLRYASSGPHTVTLSLGSCCGLKPNRDSCRAGFAGSRPLDVGPALLTRHSHKGN